MKNTRPTLQITLQHMLIAVALILAAGAFAILLDRMLSPCPQCEYTSGPAVQNVPAPPVLPTGQPTPVATSPPPTAVVQDQPVNARAVVQQWTADAPGEVADYLTDLVVESQLVSDTLDDVPAFLSGPTEKAVRQIVTDAITQSIRWTIHDPSHQMGNLYKVEAQALVLVEIDLPAVGHNSYKATLPFHLVVDVRRRTVVSWTTLIESGSVTLEISNK